MKIKSFFFVLLICGKSVWIFSQTFVFDKTYGYQDENIGGSIVQTKDTGYVMVGTMNHGDNDGISDLILIKVDKNGTIQYKKVFEDQVLYKVSRMILCQNEDIAVCGTLLNETGYQAFCLKTDSDFNRSFLYVTHRQGWTFGNHLIENKDSTLIIIGQTYDTLNYQSDGFAFKLAADGNLMCVQSSELSGHDNYTSIDAYDDENVVVCGYKASNATDTGVCFGFMNKETLKMMPIDLNYILSKSMAYDIKKDYLGNLLICGAQITTTPSYRKSYFLVKTNLYGNLLQYAFEGNMDNMKDDVYYTLCIDSAHNILVAGNFKTYSPDVAMHIHKYDENLGYLRSHNRTSDAAETISQLIVSTDGTYAGIGTTTAYGLHYKDIYMFKIADTLNGVVLPVINEVSVVENEPIQMFHICPNPVQDQIFIINSGHYSIKKIELYDMSGKLLKTYLYSNQSQFKNLNLEVSFLKAGVYIIDIHTDICREVRKIIKN